MVNRPGGDSQVLACFEPLAKTLAIAVEKSANGVARVPANDAVSECAGRALRTCAEMSVQPNCQCRNTVCLQREQNGFGGSGGGEGRRRSGGAGGGRAGSYRPPMPSPMNEMLSSDFMSGLSLASFVSARATRGASAAARA